MDDDQAEQHHQQDGPERAFWAILAKASNLHTYNPVTALSEERTFRSWLGPRSGVVLVIVLHTLLIRAWGISESFWMLDDQVRDWQLAIGPWRMLPLTGVPSNAGGTTLGPVYYWVLWLIAHTIGVWTDRLPHAGGIGLAIVQSMADGFFFAALWKKTRSGWLALAIALFVASQPSEMALTVAMSKPPLAMAFIKVAIAIVLLQGESIWWTVAGTAAAWLALQSHSTAIFFAAPVILSFTVSPIVDGRWRTAWSRACTSMGVILLLEIPYLLALAGGEGVRPGKAIESVAEAIRRPGTIHIGRTFNEVTNAAGFLLLSPWQPGWFRFFVAGCVLVTAIRFRRDCSLLSVTVIPLLLFLLGFSVYQFPFDAYYAMAVMCPLALTIGFALTAWRPSARFVGVALAIAVLACQP